MIIGTGIQLISELVLVMQVYSEQIAKNFALIHSLEIPVSKEPTWLGDTIR